MLIGKDNGIASYFFYIHPRDFKELRSDTWSEDPVPAKLNVGKNKYHVEIVYRGAHIREFPKKSYLVNFLKPAKFFGSREIHLNAEFLDPSMMRYKLSLDFFDSIGILSPESRYVFVKVNGVGIGVYLQLESVDDLFLQKRGLPAGTIYYANNDDANFSLISPFTNDVKDSLDLGYELKYGSDSDNSELCELIYKINTVSRSDFSNEISKYVAVEKYLYWLAGVVCTQNFDGFIHNYALYRNTETGLFEIIPWDCDGTWGRDCHGEIMEYYYIPIEGYNTLSARILDVPDFRRRYREILEEILKTKFTVEELKPRIMSLYTLLRPHVMLDLYKKDTISEFDAEPDYILNFIADRNKYLQDNLSCLDY